MFANGGVPTHSHFYAPAYPLEKIQDPTGAGDSFAGGFIGYLAQQGHSAQNGDDSAEHAIQRAIIHGSVVASYTVQGFGVQRLKELTTDDILARYREFKDFTNFEPTCPWIDGCEHLRGNP
jgi:sugar/nucleoside kinase (ribokinase family)